jgi:hypothetical protein
MDLNNDGRIGGGSSTGQSGQSGQGFMGGNKVPGGAGGM